MNLNFTNQIYTWFQCFAAFLPFCGTYFTVVRCNELCSFYLAEKFESMYDDAAEKVDEIAERILMLGGVPENKFSEYLKVAKIKEVSDVACGSDAVSNILETYGYLIGEERKIIELANEAGDDVTADLMTGYLKEQEKMVWMLVAFSTKGCTDK